MALRGMVAAFSIRFSQTVLCVMLLTEMFDGDLDPEEFEVWERWVTWHA
jgi:hypothetical protein